jgi:hypothetical protein
MGYNGYTSSNMMCIYINIILYIYVRVCVCGCVGVWSSHYENPNVVGIFTSLWKCQLWFTQVLTMALCGSYLWAGICVMHWASVGSKRSVLHDLSMVISPNNRCRCEDLFNWAFRRALYTHMLRRSRLLFYIYTNMIKYTFTNAWYMYIYIYTRCLKKIGI